MTFLPDSETVFVLGGQRLTMGGLRGLAAFILSMTVIIGAFWLIALEKETQIDTAMVALVSSVISAWAGYFAHMGGADTVNRTKNGTPPNP